jgi:hypothetical protein
MTKLEQIEKDVRALDPRDLEAFSTWFETFQAERWDRQIEDDVTTGKLDSLADKALTASRSANPRDF